jgi:Transposase DDE domain
MLRVLRYGRIALFLHRKSNHIFTVWQHVMLLAIRQYEGKSYRMFSEWLVEAYYLRRVLQLPNIPHFTTLQKFTERISGTMLEKIISSFIILTKMRHLFVGIDSSGFKATHASQYYTERTKLRRRKYIKLSLAADVLQQIICTIKIRRAPTRHDTIDFRPLITKTSEILPLSVVIGDKGYASIPNSICFLIKLDYQVLYFVQERVFQDDISSCEYRLENLGNA